MNELQTLYREAKMSRKYVAGVRLPQEEEAKSGARKMWVVPVEPPASGAYLQWVIPGEVPEYAPV